MMKTIALKKRIRELESINDAYRRANIAATTLLASYGWQQFGTNVENPDAFLEFSEVCDEDGLPRFERIIGYGRTSAYAE